MIHWKVSRTHVIVTIEPTIAKQCDCFPHIYLNWTKMAVIQLPASFVNHHKKYATNAFCETNEFWIIWWIQKPCFYYKHENVRELTRTHENAQRHNYTLRVKTLGSVWIKTTLNTVTGSVSGAGADPQTWKMGSYFLLSLAHRIPLRIREKLSIKNLQFLL